MPAKPNQDEMFVEAIKLLRKRPCATRTLVQVLGFYHERASKLLNILHTAGMTYIDEWLEPGQCKVKYPYYRWKINGNEEDAPKPPKQTPREIAMKHAAWRTAKRKEKEIQNEFERAC